MPARVECTVSSWFVHSLIANRLRERRTARIPPQWNRWGDSRVFLSPIQSSRCILLHLFWSFSTESSWSFILLVKAINQWCWSRTWALSNGAMKVKSKQSCLNYITHNEIIIRSTGCCIFSVLKAVNEMHRDIVLSRLWESFPPKHTNSSQIMKLYKLVY